MRLLRITGLALLALFLCSTLVTTSALADQLYITYASNNPGNGGGAFAVSQVSGGLLAGTTFNTFCLEENEYFVPGNNYTYVTNTAAVLGGNGGPSDPISIGTAYLYDKFLNEGGNYSAADQKALQEAIWFLEDETTQCTGDCRTVLNLAEAALNGKTDEQMKANADGAYGVVALNLTNGPACPGVGANCQDMLGRVPEAGATLLLSMGLAGLAWFARRKNLLPSGARPLSV